MSTLQVAALTFAVITYVIPAQTQETNNSRSSQIGTTHMSQKELWEKMMGRWEGTCRTWFEPGKLADESRVTGEITGVLGGRFLRHTYEGTIQGKPRRGEELIAFNSITKEFQTSWVDPLRAKVEWKPSVMVFWQLSSHSWCSK
jgi:hypothetical protein